MQIDERNQGIDEQEVIGGDCSSEEPPQQLLVRFESLGSEYARAAEEDKHQQNDV